MASIQLPVKYYQLPAVLIGYNIGNLIRCIPTHTHLTYTMHINVEYGSVTKDGPDQYTLSITFKDFQRPVQTGITV